MLELHIPGFKDLNLEHLVLDMFSITPDENISPNPAIKDDQVKAWLKITVL